MLQGSIIERCTIQGGNNFPPPVVLVFSPGSPPKLESEYFRDSEIPYKHGIEYTTKSTAWLKNKYENE